MAWRADNYADGWGLNRARRSPRQFAGSYFWADFQRDRYVLNGAAYRGWDNVPGKSFTRASTGYALTQAGTLQSFASDVMRRTDRGLLIEPARTNLLLRSQDFENAGWLKTYASVTADQAIAPDGTVTADKLVEDSTASNPHYISQVITTTAGATLSMSVDVQAAERSAISLQMFNGADRVRAAFNLATGAIGDSFATGTASLAQHYIEALGGGRYRCVLVGVASTSATFVQCDIFLANAGDLAGRFYTGDGTSGLYIWGAQVEAGTGASSYIPTTSATATRAADSAVITGVSITRPSAMVVEVERAYTSTGTSQRVLYVHDNQAGAANERAGINFFNGDYFGDVRAGGSAVAAVQKTGGAVGVVQKLAMRQEVNNTQLALGGSLGTADTLCAAPATGTRIEIGGLLGAEQFGGYILRCGIYQMNGSDGFLQASSA